MKAVVADTHAALWYLIESPRLSNVAHRAMRDAEDDPATDALKPASSRGGLGLLQKVRFAAPWQKSCGAARWTDRP